MPTSEIMAFIFSFLVSAFQTISELMEKQKKWWKVIVWLCLACGSFGFGLYTILTAPEKSQENTRQIIASTDSIYKETQRVIKRAIDSTQSAMLDSIRRSNEQLIQKGDSNTQAILDSKPKVEYNSLLDLGVTADGINPKIEFNKSFDSMMFTVYIRNIGNDIAVDLEDDFVSMIFSKDSTPKFFSIPNYHFFNKTSILKPENVFLYITIPMAILNGGNYKNYTGKNFLYMKIDYKNKGNKRPHVFRKIFTYIKGGVQEADSKEYDLVEKALIKFNHY